MGTLASELASHAGRIARQPRVYVDANVPARLVTAMRRDLHWDVLYVVDEPDLRRATDSEHFRLARQFHRTLITLDHDYLDDVAFPPERSGGVLVLSAPDEERLLLLLRRFDAAARATAQADADGLPLAGRKLHAHVDWTGDLPGRGAARA